MKKFQSMGELIAYMVGANAPKEAPFGALHPTQIRDEREFYVIFPTLPTSSTV